MTCRYAKNWTVQTDLASGVSDARRAVVATEWREATYTETAVQAQYLLAVAASTDTLYATEAGALAEATRQQGLRGTQLHRFDITVQYSPAVSAVDLGDVVSLSHPRYGLRLEGTDSGQRFVVLGVAPDAEARQITLTLWGASLASQNKLSESGDYRLYEDGVYMLTEN